MKLFTVGYEGFEIEDFVPFLAKNKVRRIIDTRKNPVSRKRGFSKHKLAAALAEKKIDYFHFPQLGTPSAWRKLEAKHLISREKLFKDYVDQIIPQGKEDILKIRELMKEKNSALLCYEADHCDCHRHFIAKEVKKKERGQLEIVNLERSERESRWPERKTKRS
jgi:uncharacterized protein (DUF488 family)